MAPDTVAVLGAGGTMGLPMARNLLRAGFAVQAWNRTPEKLEPLAGDGALPCGTPAEAAAGAGVVLTMLTDADAVLRAMDSEEGALMHAHADASTDVVWLQMSTIGETATERCAALARDRGVAFVDAPVLGTRAPAEAGALVVLASGVGGLRARLEPIFDAVGQRTLWLGDAGSGTRLKLIANNWVLSVVEAGAETIALAEGLGIDPSLFFAAIEGSALDLPYLRMKAHQMTERDFTPSFRLALAAKDARLVEEAAQARDLDLPLVGAIRRRLLQGAAEHGEDDMSATFLTSAPRPPLS